MDYTLADIAAAARGKNGECGNSMNQWADNPLMILAFMYLFGGGGFGGFGGGSQALTRAEMYDGFSMNQLQNDTRDIERSICAANTSNLQGQSNILQAIAQQGFNAQSCCCETNRNIDSVRYDLTRNIDGLRYDTQKQTCDITAAIHADGEATRALITQNLIQGLRDQVAAKDREVLVANFQLSQQAQSANLIETLNPKPIPAYITCSPYQASYGMGCGWGIA